MAGIGVAGALVAAMVVFGQGPGRRGATTTATGTTVTPPADAVKTYLSLTDSQLTGFTAIRTTARTASEPILTQLRTKEIVQKTFDAIVETLVGSIL